MGDWGAGAEPAGTVRVAGYATALLRRVVPAVRELVHRHPDLRVVMEEREPGEVSALLAEDAVDVGLVYEYSLVPQGTAGRRIGAEPMVLAVPAGETRSLEELLVDPGVGWISNSRHHTDDELIRRLAARFGTQPRIAHRIDSLELVGDLVAAGLGCAVVADIAPAVPGVRVADLDGAAGVRTGFAVTRPGREDWPPNRALIDAISGAAPAPSAPPAGAAPR